MYRVTYRLTNTTRAVLVEADYFLVKDGAYQFFTGTQAHPHQAYSLFSTISVVKE